MAFMQATRVLEDRPGIKGLKCKAGTKILSRCLVVIEMAFAAVYSVVHAARR